MCTRILKTRSSSKRLSFFKLLFIVLLSFIYGAQNFKTSGMEGEEEEKKLNSQNAMSSQQSAAKVVFDRALLEEIDPTLTEEELNKIIQCLGYLSDEDYREEIREKARQQGWFTEDPQGFQKVLLERAWMAAIGPLQVYLRDLLMKINDLQKVVPEFEKQDMSQTQKISELFSQIKVLRLEIENIGEEKKKTAAEQEARRLAHLNELKKKDKHLWVYIPSACLVVGVFAMVATRIYYGGNH